MAARRRRTARRRSSRRSSLGSDIGSMARPMMGMVALGGTMILGAGILHGVGDMLGGN